MTASSPPSFRRLALTSLVSLLASGAGLLCIRARPDMLRTDPAWVGPAAVVGTLAFLVCVMLLTPAVARVIRRGRNP